MAKSNYIETISYKHGNYKKYINPGNLNTNREKNNRLTVRIQLVEQFAKHFPTLLSTVGTKYSSVYTGTMNPGRYHFSHNSKYNIESVVFR